jgi:hypothetical protein
VLPGPLLDGLQACRWCHLYLGQHAHGGADLLIATLVCEQSSQDFFSNRVFGGVQRAVIAPL